MTAKEYLSTVQKLKTKIEQKKVELLSVRDAATHISAGFNPTGVKNTSVSDKVGEYAAKIVDMETEMLKEIENSLLERFEIVNRIQALNNSKYIELLYKRYIELKPLDVISAEMGYTYQYIQELHSKALKAFEKAHKAFLER